jgi:hypothetical protein
MKKINRTLLLLAGITANILLACSTGENENTKEPYSAKDTLHGTEHINTPDSISEDMSTPDNGIDKQTD